MRYNFKILRSENGYAVFEWNNEALFWVQITKWYKRLGNLKRFNPKVNEWRYYDIKGKMYSSIIYKK